MADEQVDNDALAHLIREALQNVGNDADPLALADRIKRLELGLPLEDEFIMLISWLGKCRLAHKLDQSQFPPASKSAYRVPDLFAVFEYKDRLIPVLIEIKGKRATSFRWRPDYVEGLQRYAELVGVPILLACKWQILGLWTLIGIDQFEQAVKNRKYTLPNALRQNLMGSLAGDFMIVFKEKVGLHLRGRKEAKLGSRQEGTTFSEQWKIRIEDAFFTDGNGSRVNLKDDNTLWSLFLSADVRTKTSVDETHIIHSLMMPEEMQPAHQSLVVLLSHWVDEQNPLIWRQALLSHEEPMECSQLREAAVEGIERNYVQYVLDPVPETTPDFLN